MKTVSCILVLLAIAGCQVAKRIPGAGNVVKALDKAPGDLGDAVNLVKAPDPITTHFGQCDKTLYLPNDFGDGLSPVSLTTLPKGPNGGYLLSPGFYEFTCQSYCLKAGTHAPGKGDGYLYAPLEGKRKDIVLAILRNYSKQQGSFTQQQVQTLLWAIIARASFKQMTNELKLTAAKLLTPAQLLELNGGALGLVPDAAIQKAAQGLPPAAQKIFEAENKMRRLFNSGSYKYAELERLAVLAGDAVIDNPAYKRGRWSKHPDGYFVRYLPHGYSRTTIQVYMPGFALQRIHYNQPRPEFDAGTQVATPANNGSQRLAQSNVPADGGTPAPRPRFDPCTPVLAGSASEAEQRDATNFANTLQNFIRNTQHYAPDATGFATMDEAASAAIGYINATSINEHVEYAGRIYRGTDGRYYFSAPVRGTRDDSHPEESPIPAGGTEVANYHTHGGQFENSDEYFSPGDFLKATFKRKPSYLGTPRGRIQRFDPGIAGRCPQQTSVL